MINRANAVSVYYDSAEVETCEIVRANCNANFDVYSDISDEEIWKIVAINAVQYLFRYSVHLKVSGLE